MFGPSTPICTLFHRCHSICNFCSFCKNHISRRGPLNLLFYCFSLTGEFSNYLQILQYWQFLHFWQKSHFLSGPSQPLRLQVFTDLTNLLIFRRFYNIYNFSSFRKNCSSFRGPLNLLFYWFSLTRRIFQYFANFAIFAAVCKPGHISACLLFIPTPKFNLTPCL